MKIITNRSKAQRTYKTPGPAGQPPFETRHVFPMGATEVDDDVFAALKAEPNFKAAFNRGIMQVRDVPAEAPEVVYEVDDVIVDLRQLSVKEALRAIAACSDKARLQQWLDQDGRRKVRDALMDRGMDLLGESGARTEADAVDAPSGPFGKAPVFGGDA